MPPRKEIHWRADAKAGDYAGALSFLSLLRPVPAARRAVARLRRAKNAGFRAKDVLRASGLALLGRGDADVARNRRKIAGREPLSPVLLLRDPARGRVLVVDGYHRLCAAHSVDRDAEVQCRMA